MYGGGVAVDIIAEAGDDQTLSFSDKETKRTNNIELSFNWQSSREDNAHRVVQKEPTHFASILWE